MNMIPVASSHVDSIGHNGKTTMIVQYKNGNQYKFVATFAEYEDILNSESVGKALKSYKGVPV